MSFFNIDMPQNGSFETGGGDIEPIPAKTQVLAAPDEVKWDSFGDEASYISIRWVVMAPKEYKNRKVFQKLRVQDNDQKKADKAKRMLAAIDQNAGGKLIAAGVQPDDASLTKNLVNCQMVLMLQVWELEINGEERKGNWISAVSPKKNSTPSTAQPPTHAPEPAKEQDDFEDEDIPF